ncbi:MAG: hypothetical protein IAE89_16275 [Anaerolineae bacterium]|nr:hypothetical protein [Anaerolineae bacterium]
MTFYLEDDDPQPIDIENSWRTPDSETDLGWAEDKTWTKRRIIITAIVLFALIAFLATTMIGVLEFVNTVTGGAPTPVPTIPLPRV